MANVNDRSALSAPRGQKACNIRFSPRIISWPMLCVIGRVDGLLHVNDKKRRPSKCSH